MGIKMKITKIGVLDDRNRIEGHLPPMVAAILTNLECNELNSTRAVMLLYVGKGPSARKLELDVLLPNSVLSRQTNEPVSVTDPECFKLHGKEWVAVMFLRNQLFLVTTPFLEPTSVEEAVLQVKKLAYADDNRLARLRQEVKAIERVLNHEGVKRTPIPETVKLVVWARDQGQCVRCGSKENLHFDHIIPVSKGGGNSEQNVQVLCERCNLQKSDKIAF